MLNIFSSYTCEDMFCIVDANCVSLTYLTRTLLDIVYNIIYKPNFILGFTNITKIHHSYDK